MSGLFGDDDPPPAPTIRIDPPAPPAPVPRADPNDPANREARRRAQAAMQTGGRAATLLSPPRARANPAGAANFDSYAATRLGTGA
jgi:hypothetical protein